MADEVLKVQLNKTFAKWSQRATMHGLTNIVDRKSKPIRFAWLGLFCISIAFCLYMNVESLVDFFQYKVYVSIREDEKAYLDFPTIGICNLNGFKNEMFRELILNNSNGLEDHAECVKNSVDWTACFDGRFKALQVQSYFKMQYLSAVRNKEEFSLRVNETLLSCLHDRIQCAPEHLTEKWHQVYGFCFLLNDGTRIEKLKSYTPGIYNGLQLELILKRNNDSSMPDFKNGIDLFILNNNEELANFEVSAGIEMRLKIKTVHRRKLSSPYSNCINGLKPDTQFSRTIIQYFKYFNATSYSVKNCEEYCVREKLIQHCNCTIDESVMRFKNVSRCKTQIDFTCSDNFLKAFNSNWRKACEYICADECDKIEFQIEKEELLNPYFRDIIIEGSRTKNLSEFLSKNYSIYPQNSLLKLKIYFDKISTTLMEDNPQMTFKQLLGNMGGQLGLFIGISVLSCIEIMELLTSCLFVSLRHLKSEIVKKRENRQLEDETEIN